MNVIQIFLKTSGSIAELYKDFNLYKGLYRNTQISVYVPKSILYNEDGFTNAVKTGAILTTPNGSKVTTQSYFTLYLQDETINGIEYAVYTQVMPKVFAQYAGTQTIVVNVSSTDSNESTPQIVAVTTSQTAQLVVMDSAYLDQDEPIEPSQTEVIEGQINELGERIDANKTQIEANAANIAKNTEDIATNASNIAKNTSDIAEINEKLPDIEQDAADAVEAAKQAAASAEAAQSDAAAAAASANASAASASQANNSAIAANNSAIAAANSAAQIEDMKTTFALKDESASSLEVSLNNATFVLTMTLKDINGNTLSTQTVDFPIESMVVGISYNEATKTLIFQLQSGSTIEVPIDDIVDGLATQTALDNVINGTTPVAKATAADTAGQVDNALTVVTDGVSRQYNGSAPVTVTINTTSSTDPESVHFTSQTLNDSQQAQARENIGAASKNNLEDYPTNDELNTKLEDYLPLKGGKMSGEILMGENPLNLGGDSQFIKQTDGNYVNLKNANFNVLDGIVQEGGQRVYSPNNPQTTIAHADNATKATQDSDGNTIIDTYQKVHHLYEHKISLRKDNGTSRVYAYLTWISNKEDGYTRNEFCNELLNAGYTETTYPYPATGYNTDEAVNYTILGVSAASSTSIRFLTSDGSYVSFDAAQTGGSDSIIDENPRKIF